MSALVKADKVGPGGRVLGGIHLVQVVKVGELSQVRSLVLPICAQNSLCKFVNMYHLNSNSASV